MLAEGTTDRTVLMAQMGRMGRDFSLAAADIVRSNLNDSLADPDELRTWLANMECLDADRLAVASLVQEGDFSNALALAGSLPQLYGMQDGSLDEHDDYTLPLGATKATLTFTNALGVAVMTAELNGSQGQKVLDLRPLAAGVYGYDVRCGEYVLNGKMVVTK